MKEWFKTWFNEDYLKLYANRSLEEAEGQVAFIIKALQLKGTERVLDLGCGFGRHSLSFAKRGFSVLGVDLSPFLISRAKELLQGLSSQDLPYTHSLDIEFIEGDICDLGRLLDKRGVGYFDVVVSLFTSFGYFEEDTENIKVFQAAFHYLKKGGKFFFDYLHPSKVKREHIPFEKQRVGEETVEIYKKLDGDFVIKRVVFSGRGDGDQREYIERVKLYNHFQIEEMLKSVGFSIEAIWNDYTGNSWREEGDRQIFYCVAR